MSSTFQLNESYFNVLGSEMATVVQSPSVDTISSMYSSGYFMSCGLTLEQPEFVFQENMSHISFSMAISHDPNKNMTTGTVFGLSDNLMEGLVNTSIQSLIDYIKASTTLIGIPTLVPTLAKRALALKATLNAESCHDSIFKIELSTRMRKKMENLEGATDDIPDWSQVDLLDATRSLNSVCTELAWGNLDARSSISLLNFLEKINHSYCPDFDPTSRHILCKDDLTTVVSTLTATNEYLQSWYRGIEERCQYLEKRAQAQVQTVRLIRSRQE